MDERSALLIDQNPGVLMALEGHLTEQGCRTLTAGTSADALSLLEGSTNDSFSIVRIPDVLHPDHATQPLVGPAGLQTFKNHPKLLLACGCRILYPVLTRREEVRQAALALLTGRQVGLSLINSMDEVEFWKRWLANESMKGIELSLDDATFDQ
ncbi:MAG: hypothetical protein ABIG34_02575 [Candidatus Peregrinibacteria bacterium]